jgi:hypothetical protein
MEASKEEIQLKKTVITTQKTTIIEQIQTEQSVSAKRKSKDPSLIHSIKSLASNFLAFGESEDALEDASHVSKDLSNSEWQRFNSYSEMLETDEEMPTSFNIIDEMKVETELVSASLTSDTFYSALEESIQRESVQNEEKDQVNNEDWIDYVRDKLAHESEESSLNQETEQETLVGNCFEFKLN